MFQLKLDIKELREKTRKNKWAIRTWGRFVPCGGSFLKNIFKVMVDAWDPTTRRQGIGGRRETMLFKEMRLESTKNI